MTVTSHDNRLRARAGRDVHNRRLRLRDGFAVTVHSIVPVRGWARAGDGVSMSGSVITEVAFPAEPTSPARARRAVRKALAAVDATHLGEVAELAVSELVTNAVVHAGTQVRVRITAEPTAVRVEVGDGSPRLPVLRGWTDTAGTGRGLRIVDQHADRWGAGRVDDGKVVWFEVGRPVTPIQPRPDALALPPTARVDIMLLDVPLLMHWAWQEHAATLLREYLLYALERDGRALDDHVAASSALGLLDEQVPKPELPSQPDALMASAVEPVVSAAKVTLRIPTSSVPHFLVLDDLLVRAVDAAQDGRLLSPPTQPEMAEMREWLCGEVVRQAGAAEPTPWLARTDVRTVLDPASARAQVIGRLVDTDQAMIATDDTSVIVAVTPSVIAFLGYAAESDLLGRRILAVVPARFHQAHIAGTTLHVTNGRDALLNQWITAPMVRADGTEVLVGMHVHSHRLDGDARVFLARLRLPEDE
jgi:PAS domain S-box-containing protein